METEKLCLRLGNLDFMAENLETLSRRFFPSANHLNDIIATVHDSARVVTVYLANKLTFANFQEPFFDMLYFFDADGMYH